MIFTRKLLWAQQNLLSERNIKGMNDMAYLEELTDRYPGLDPVKESVRKAYEILKECFSSGHKLLVAGNGGSAADSEHIVGELMKGFVKRRCLPEDMVRRMEEIDGQTGRELASKLQEGLPAIALTGHPGLSTAFLNDVDGQLCFAQQILGYGKKGDVFLGISTSGNSANILYGAIVAKAQGMKVIGLTGRGGGRLASIADVVVAVDEQETYKVQELHLPVYHCLCLMVEKEMFGSTKV